MEVLNSTQGLILTQRKFTLELLKEFNCDNCVGVSTRLDVTSKLRHDEGDFYSDPTKYRQLVGKLNFVIHTQGLILPLLYST